MTDVATVLAKVETDLTAFTHSGNPMFPGGVHVGVSNIPAKAWMEPPLAIVASGDHEPDEDDPTLGDFFIVVNVYTKDTRGNYGEATAKGTDDIRGRAALETIRQYLRDNYSYKAGGDYGAAMYLEEGFTEIEEVTPADLEQGEDEDEDFPSVYVTTGVYRVIQS